MKTRRKEKGIGFSLDAIAAILVMLILTVIVSINAPTLITNSKSNRAETDVAALGGYISEYKLETGSYPTSLNELTQTDGQYGPWITKVPKDPWGNTYQYKKTDSKFVVYSMGPDKAESGSSAENGVVSGDIGFAGR